MDSSEQETARRLLERELRLLDPRDLRSHAWYHGSTLRGGRRGAETEVPNEGDFLVRDCASQPGNYVLTVRCKGQPLHFVIDKVVLQPDTVYERAQYQFEDEAFDTVADLITFYVGSGRPVSQASGARIVNPRPRSVPLSRVPPPPPPPPTATGTATVGSSSSSVSSSPSSSTSSSSSASLPTGSPPRLPRKQQRSHSLTPHQQHHPHHPHHARYRHPAEQQLQEQHGPGVTQRSTLTRVASISGTQSTSGSSSSSSSLSLGRQPITRVISDPALQQRQRYYHHHQDTGSSQGQATPPPKPPRISVVGGQAGNRQQQLKACQPEQQYHHPHPNPPRQQPHHDHHYRHHRNQNHDQNQHHQAYQASGSDSGNGSGDSEFELNNSGSGGGAAPIKGVVIRNPHFGGGEGIAGAGSANNDNENEDDEENNAGTLDDYEPSSVEEQLLFAAPSFDVPSLLDVDGFATLLLPTGDHRPLDATALRGVSGMLHESAPRVLAAHLTRADLVLALEPGVGNRAGLTGLELATLPHARRARLDIIERTECLKLLVAVTVLAGTSAIERAATIGKWIKVAVDTKTALGNLYGFCSVMLGLCLPQVQKLANTWHVLRQRHTDDAFSFEAKLRPTLRAMNECTNPQAPNATVPHLLPIALLGERGLEDVTGSSGFSSLVGAILSPWENSAADCGLSIVWSHLESSRKLVEGLPLFRRNAEIALEGCRNDELLTDAFRTEFHIRFLWGSRGAAIGPEERYSKFAQVLDAMYEKCAATE